MDCYTIDYCASSAYLIRNNRQKSDILNSIEKQYNIAPIHWNKIPYNDRLLSSLQKDEFLISLISGGGRYLLWLTRFNGWPVSILIQRKMDDGFQFPTMIVLQLCLKDIRYFDNSLFEVNVIRNKNNSWMIQLSDVFVLKGKPFRRDLLSKIEEMFLFISNNVIIVEYNISWCVKKYFTSTEISKQYETIINETSYHVNGLCWHHTRLDKEIVFMNNVRLYDNFKTIPIKYIEYNDKGVKEDLERIQEEFRCLEKLIGSSEETERFIHETEDNLETVLVVRKSSNYGIYNCFASYVGDLVEYGILRFKNIKMVQQWTPLFKMSPSLRLKCRFSKQFKKWIPIEAARETDIIGKVDWMRSNGIYFHIKS